MAELEGYLCVMSNERIFGMDVRKLLKHMKPEGEEVVVDWGSLPSHPVDFSVDLPHRHMHRIVLDSKVHLAGGFTERPTSNGRLWDPSYKIYVIDIVDGWEKKKARFTVTESVPDAPAPFINYVSSVATISGDAYFLMHRKCGKGLVNDLWVLHSEGKQWEHLRPPPSSGHFCKCFVLNDNKLFVETFFPKEEEEEAAGGEGGGGEEEEEDYFVSCSFNHRTGTWTLGGDDSDFVNSFCLRIDGKPRFVIPSITVSVPCLSNFQLQLLAFMVLP